MRWAENVTSMGLIRNLYKMIIEISEEKSKRKRNRVKGCGLNSPDSGLRPVAGFCGKYNKILCFTVGTVHQMSDWASLPHVGEGRLETIVTLTKMFREHYIRYALFAFQFST
jgi:hypothetical protein